MKHDNSCPHCRQASEKYVCPESPKTPHAICGHPDREIAKGK